MKKTMILVVCVKERKNIFGGKERELYFLDPDSIVHLTEDDYGDIYERRNGSPVKIGFFNLNRFIKLDNCEVNFYESN